MKPSATHSHGIWASAGITLLCVAAYIGAIAFMNGERAELAALNVELAAEARREESMHELGALLKSMQEEREAIDGYFVRPSGVVAAIEEIERLSAAIGAPASVSDVHLESTDETGEGTLVMSVSALGSWSAISQLVYLLDAFPYQSELRSASLTAKMAEAGSEWTVRASLVVPVRN